MIRCQHGNDALVASGLGHLIQSFSRDILDRRSGLGSLPFNGVHRSILTAVKHIQAIHGASAPESLRHSIPSFDSALILSDGSVVIQLVVEIGLVLSLSCFAGSFSSSAVLHRSVRLFLALFDAGFLVRLLFFRKFTI